MNRVKLCFYISIILLFNYSCKKIAAKHFELSGNLVDSCNGSAESNIELHLYKNESPGLGATEIFYEEEELLETTTTNENGFFQFLGEGYVTNQTNTIYNSSIRLNDGTILANGRLGKGKASKSEHDSNANLGNLFQSGIKVDMTLHISTSDDLSQHYDSVRVISWGQGINTMVTDSVMGWFYVTLPTIKSEVKEFYTETENSSYFPNNGGYFLPQFQFRFYNNGQETLVNKDFWFTECINNEAVYFTPE